MDGWRKGRLRRALKMGHGSNRREATKLKTLSLIQQKALWAKLLLSWSPPFLVLVLVLVLVVAQQRSGQAPSSGNLGGTPLCRRLRLCCLGDGTHSLTRARRSLRATTTTTYHHAPPRNPPTQTQQQQDPPPGVDQLRRGRVACLRRSGPLRTERRALRTGLACLCRPIFHAAHSLTAPPNSGRPCCGRLLLACLSHSCQPLELLDSRWPATPTPSLSPKSGGPDAATPPPRGTPALTVSPGLRADLSTLVYFILLPASLLPSWSSPAFLSSFPSFPSFVSLTARLGRLWSFSQLQFLSFSLTPFFASRASIHSGRPVQRARAHSHRLLWPQSYLPAPLLATINALPVSYLTCLTCLACCYTPSTRFATAPTPPPGICHGCCRRRVPRLTSLTYIPTLPLPLPLRPDSGAFLITSGLLLPLCFLLSTGSPPLEISAPCQMPAHHRLMTPIPSLRRLLSPALCRHHQPAGRSDGVLL